MWNSVLFAERNCSKHGVPTSQADRRVVYFKGSIDIAGSGPNGHIIRAWNLLPSTSRLVDSHKCLVVCLRELARAEELNLDRLSSTRDSIGRNC